MKKLNTKGFSAIEAILLIVIVGIIGFVGWYVWNNNKKHTPDTTSTSEPAAALTNDSYADWVIHNSTSLSATFKYPSNWAESNSPTNGVTLISSDFHATSDTGSITTGSKLSVTEGPLTGETLNSIVDGSMTPVTNKQNITVDGVEAIRYTTTGMGEGRGNRIIVVMIKGDKTYYITQDFKLDADNPYSDLMTGIVATFRFKN